MAKQVFKIKKVLLWYFLYNSNCNITLDDIEELDIPKSTYFKWVKEYKTIIGKSETKSNKSETVISLLEHFEDSRIKELFSDMLFRSDDYNINYQKHLKETIEARSKIIGKIDSLELGSQDESYKEFKAIGDTYARILSALNFDIEKIITRAIESKESSNNSNDSDDINDYFI